MAEPVFLTLDSVSSTQDAARDLPIGSVVSARHQSAGRGRLDRRWEAPPGSALLATFVTPLHPLASLAAGVAAAEACRPPVRLKWPNDLLAGGRKLGGILVEAGRGRCLIGIGINLTWAPEGGAMLGPTDEAVLLARIQAGLTNWLSEPQPLMLDRWRLLADTLGREVRVELGSESFIGIADGIASNGSLLVSGRTVSAGEITHLRVVGDGAAPHPPDPL